MEPDMVTEMIIETAKKGVKVTGIVGDDDTTTAARLKTNAPHMVEKRSDKNHVKKNLAYCLYGMQKNFPTLSTKIINYLLKLFNYNISQNKQNPVGISRGMDAVVGHVFGDHSFCDDTWCRFIHNSSAKYSSLPYGRPLTNLSLKAALLDVFGAYKKIAPKLSMLGSTQANESLNKSIAIVFSSTTIYEIYIVELTYSPRRRQERWNVKVCVPPQIFSLSLDILLSYFANFFTNMTPIYKQEQTTVPSIL
ncbi:hypothetical protein DPMN_154786 [Dreissena polymorpha]|uniref:Mutator-like transposase domain-containing protein n=1 Tax=Dreissena polymorpha TaxID=45954 RepID=A0A9D4J7A7_DREPO|nr:hypothetical protein DPMN_154786 [Dreissena polymorpha]